ncbi:MAG: SURF1 family protein [Betaproteobacteria bacterium]
MTRTRTAIALVAAVAGIAATVALGNWQTRRAEQKLALEAQWDAAFAMTPAMLDANSVAQIAQRLPVRVRAEGEFVHAKSVWLDNRQLDGRAGLWLATPLRTADGAVVLVLRGWAARDPADRARLPAPAQPAGRVAVEGIALAQAPRLYELGSPQTSGPLPAVWQNLDLPAYERASGLTVAPLIVMQTSDLADDLVRRWARPASGVEKHRGYAFQWYALAATLAVLTAVLGQRSLRRAKENRDPT